MSRSTLTWEGRRALTDNAAARPEEHKKAADELLEANALYDATHFFGLAGDQEGLNEVLEIAVRDGNFFIFKSVLPRLSQKPSKDVIQALAEAAHKNGQLLYAEQAAAYIAENY